MALLPSSPFAMSAAGLVLLVVGLWAARKDLAQARGLDKIVALNGVCFALPLAVFGAEHLARERLLLNVVPSYLPWRVFWLYFVGVALIAGSFSIATRVQLRWSALLVGILMFLFVAMIHLPGAIRFGGRIPWTVVVRESSFGGAGLVLAGSARLGDGDRWGPRLIAVGRVPIGIAAVVFGVLHFLHPLVLPGLPLVKLMPAWIPARPVIDYVTGAFLIVAGACFLLARRTRLWATWLGAWIVLLVVVIYGPVLVGALADPRAAVKVEGLSYFADTLLFGGAILSLAHAMRVSETAPTVAQEVGAAPAK